MAATSHPHSGEDDNEPAQPLPSGMSARMRPYARQADLDALLAFLLACRAADPQGDYAHVGDLLWSWRDPSFISEHNILLCEGAAGALIGVAKVDPPSLLSHVSPQVRYTALAARLLAWGIARLRDVARDAGEAADAWLLVRDDNHERIACLESQEFVRSENYFSELVRDLDQPSPHPQIPAGFTLRDGPTNREVEAYAAMHRDAWGPASTYTAEVHRRLMGLPGYRADLNPLIVAPDGTFAASCICWLDSVNCIGEIEPLGARPAFRRLGLARGRTRSAQTHEGKRHE